MVDILYTLERPFMTKTFEAIERHTDAPSAALPVTEDARDTDTDLDVLSVDDPHALDENVRRVDPSVVVVNHRYPFEKYDFHQSYPAVHVRHGASFGRGEIAETNREVLPYVDLALAPGERWAERYPADLPVSVVGVPEADEFVGDPPPRERRVLYAPTNHTHGRGSLLPAAERVLDTFADTDFELLFRPHPVDVTEEPARSVVERCRERITDVENVTFDANSTPGESLRRADVLVSDYSGIVTEWLHTGRPLIQLTEIVANREVPPVGYATDRLRIETVERLYAEGYPDSVAERRERVLKRFGVPMDGRAGERAAAEIAKLADGET